MKFIKIADVIDLVSGRDLNKEQYNDLNKGIPYIMGASNMNKGVLHIERWTEEPTVVGFKDDIVMSVKGTVGELLILQEEQVHLSRQVMSIRVKKNIDKKYMFYYLRYYVEKLKEKAKGMIPGITREDILQADFAYMDISEQKKVVDCLVKAEELLNKRKEQIEACEELIKSQFIEMFGNPITNPMSWDLRELNAVCDVRDGTHDSPSYVIEGYPLVTSKNIINGALDLSNVNYIDKVDYDKINQRSKVDINDIIMPMIGTIGNPLIVIEEPNFAIKNVALIKFTKTEINNMYVHAVLSSELMERLKQERSRGGTQKFLSLGDIRKLKVPIPPIELQNQFAQFVQQVDKLKFEMEQSLVELENNFNSLMQRVFKGELF